MRAVLFAALLAVYSGAATAAEIDGRRVLADVQELSSDAYLGRGPASEGEDKTVAFLIERMTSAGLKPGGDLSPSGERAWTQDVPLARFRTDGPVAVAVRMADKVQDWVQGEQIAIRAAQTGQDRVTIKDAPVVFVGYGVRAPERGWDDFKGVDLKGKVALVLINDPDLEGGEGDFGGRAMTYYGRWTYKFERTPLRPTRPSRAGSSATRRTPCCAPPDSTLIGSRHRPAPGRSVPSSSPAWPSRPTTASRFTRSSRGTSSAYSRAPGGRRNG
jgi:hypothetical protein